MGATRLPNGRRRVNGERSGKKEVLEGAKSEPTPGGARTLSSSPSSPHLRRIEAPLFVHSFIHSLVLERALACMDLPRDAANLDLQLEEKSILLDIQSGISESGSDILAATNSGRLHLLLFFPFLSRRDLFRSFVFQ